MSLGTVAGFFGGILLFLISIWWESPDVGSIFVFLSLSSALIVFGGTLANAFICYQGVYVTKSLKEIFKIFSHAKVDGEVIINEINKMQRKQ